MSSCMVLGWFLTIVLIKFALIAILCTLRGLANARAFISTPASFDNIQEGQTVPFCVNLTEPADGTVTVTSILLADSVSTSDFNLPSEDLVFTADGPTQQCLSLEVPSDDIVEQGELFELQLGGDIPIGNPGSSFITIVDASRINVSFSQESYTTAGESGVSSVCAGIVGGTIERSVIITFESTNLGTASSTEDYMLPAETARTFTVEAASQLQCAPITILEDMVIEEDESLVVSLTGDAVNYIVDSATVFIADDDGVELALSPGSTLIQQSEGNSGLTDVEIGITVSWPAGRSLTRDVTVLASTVDGGATAANNDFVSLTNEPFVIPQLATNGETFAFIVQIVGDLVNEDTELFSVRFSVENSNDAFTSSTLSRIRIEDDGDMVRDCGALADPANGQVTVTPNTLEDSVASYSCDNGYNLVGDETRTCVRSSGWDGAEPMCQIVNCGNPPTTSNGAISSSGTTFGGRAIYSCVPGYSIDGDTPTVTRECQADGMWSGDTPQCARISCGTLPPLTNGVVNYPDGDTLFESRAQYECDPGYNIQGASERICQANGQWSLSAPTCNPVNCGSLTNPESGMVEVSSMFFPGTATYSCNTNFELENGPQMRMCQPDGTWSENEPTCQVIQCPTLDRPANGQVMIDVASNGDTTANYECDEGYDLMGESSRNCQPNSQWSGSAPTCQIVQCPALTDPPNGSVDMPSRDFQSEAVYSCNIGYSLIGLNTTTCQSNQMWSNSPPVCIIVSCGGLSAPVNGTLTLQDVVFESVATYACDDGFRINGPTTRTCQDTGLWSEEPPTCEAFRCPNITVVNGGVSYTDERDIGSVAVVTCDEGLERNGPSSRMCGEDGMWSGEENTCTTVVGPSSSSLIDIILVIGMIAAVLILISMVIIALLSIYIVYLKKQLTRKQTGELHMLNQQHARDLNQLETMDGMNEMYEDIDELHFLPNQPPGDYDITQCDAYGQVREHSSSNHGDYDITQCDAYGQVTVIN